MPYYTMEDGEQLYVREFGQGQPVLVLSGLGMKSWQWLPFLYPLHKQYRFYIPDWRGFGGSAQCQIPKLELIASHWRDLNCFLAQQPHPHFSVIAYSMGATTALHGVQYGHFKSYLHRYLHIDQSPKISVDAEWPHGLFAEKHAYFKTVLASILELLTTNAHSKWVSELSASTRTALAYQWLKLMQLQGTSSRALALVEKIIRQPRLHTLIFPLQRLDYMAWYIKSYLEHQEDYRRALSQLDCPTTFFIGEQSQLYSALGQKIMATFLPHSNTVIFAKSGHAPLLREPLKFFSEVQHFLKRHS